MRNFTIATRESRLALWQAEHVKALLEQGGDRVTLLGMTTKGDQILDRSLSKVGGKGLFVKELEVALEEGRADLAVHSLKDVPMELPEGFVLACVMEREDPRDAWVSNRYASLQDLPQGGVVGTSSLRRVALLRALRPDLRFEPLRGNLDTRLRKLDDGQYDGIVLAAAGLKRLGLASRIRAAFPVEQMLPAAGQGALGVEVRAGREDVAAALQSLAHQPTWLAVAAERAVSRMMGGSCSMPLAAYATLEGAQLHIRAAWGDAEGRHPLVTAQAQGPVQDLADAVALGEQVALLLQAALPRPEPDAMRVIVTRPEGEAHKWVTTLRNAGYQAWSLPLIDVLPAAQPAAEDAWTQIAQWDAVMFVSRNAVDHFFALKPAGTHLFNAQSALQSRAYVTGPGSYSALLRAGAQARWIDSPDHAAGLFDSESLWHVVRGQMRPGFRLLIVRGTTVDGAAGDEGVGRDWFARQATAAGARVDFVVAYQRQQPQLDPQQREQAYAAANDGSVWLFSSSEAIANLLAQCPAQMWDSARAVVTHPRIGKVARAAGFGVVRESRPALPALMASIESLQ